MKRISIVVLAVILSISLCACKGAGESNLEPGAVVTIAPQDNEAYSKVCDNQVEKMKKLTPKVVKEYNQQAKKLKAQGLPRKKLEEKLDKLYADSLAKAAKIYVEGVSSMTEVKNNAVNEVGYQEWTQELYTAYSKETEAISKAYHDSLK